MPNVLLVYGVDARYTEYSRPWMPLQILQTPNNAHRLDRDFWSTYTGLKTS
jgi:hypothetical protein